MAEAKRDGNFIPAILGVSNSDGLTPVILYADPTTHRLLVDVTGGFGSSATDDSAFTVASSSFNVTGGIYKSTLDAVDDGDAGAFSMTAKRAMYVSHLTPLGDSMVDDTNDAMKVNIVAGSTSGTQYTEADTDTTITGTAIMWEDTSDTLRAVSAAKPLPIGDAGGSLTVDNGGTFAVQAAQSGTWNVTNVSGTVSLPTGASTLAEQQSQTTHLATIAGDTTDIETAVELIDDAIVADDAGFTPATTKVMMSGFEADEASTDSVDEGDAGAARMTLDRKQIVTTQPHTTGGLSIFRSLDLDESEEDVKTSAGQVYGMWVTNTATSTRFIKFYNATAANVTVGSTTPVITWGIPGNSSDDISAVFASSNGITFDTAISVAATTGVADNDTGAPGANEVIVNIFYK